MSRDVQRHAGDQMVIDQAVAQGILPASAQSSPMGASRPWPVLLLTALGAWLAALPLIAVIGLLFGDALTRGGGLYLVGVLVLAGAAVVLRSAALPLFAEQMAVPALLVGGGALGMALVRDLGDPGGAVALGLVALAIGVGLPRAWLRVLLGAVAALCFGLAWSLAPWSSQGVSAPIRLWVGCHAVLAAWVLAQRAQAHVERRAGGAAAAVVAEPLAGGWLVATLLMLALSSGMTFLVGGVMGGSGPGNGWAGSSAARAWMQGISAALAVAGAARLSAAWPEVPRQGVAVAGLVATALAALMPGLGGALLALALCAAHARWRLAAAAAVGAVWIVGAFYYELDLPLSTKALLLVAAGAGLAAVGMLLRRQDAAAESDAQAQPTDVPAPVPRARVALVLAAVATLVLVNAGIWQKERLIAQGRPVFLALVPVDPRSLVQGDYMALNVRIPEELQARLAQRPRVGATRPRLVARADADGVATLLRVDEGRPLAEGEFPIELTPKEGRWIVVTNAWFFQEGEAARWAQARYGEFRVDAQGRALLVGLRDDALGRL